MARESKCPHCGAKVKAEGGAVLGRTAGAMLMGLTLAGCPADDDEGTTTMGNGSTTMNNGSSGVDPSNSSTANEVTSGGFDSSGPVGEAYGVPDTETFSGGSTEGDTESTGSGDTGSGSDSGSGSGTDAGSTGISPDYGVPTSG